ncbi:MAG: hypothetical protein VX642_13625 [Bdellovibrionota bacterium]|nr:hypothetical protein [Bdellovibrionota bacterium]
MNRPLGDSLEFCSEVDIDLRNLSTTAVRAFVDCLNGDEERVAAYKLFLDETSEEDLEILLSIYNRHMVNESRFKKALELYNHMQVSGNFDKFMQAFATLAEYDILQDFLPLLKELYEISDATAEPAILALNDFIIQLIIEDDLEGAIFSFTKFLDSGRARLLAKLLAVNGSSLIGMDSDKIIDDFANAIYYGIQTGGFNEFSLILYDPVNYQLLKDLFAFTPGGLAGINSYLEYLSIDQDSENRLDQLTKLTRATNRPVKCFENSGEFIQIDNLFKLGFEELKARRFNTPEQMASFYIEEVPFHLQNLKAQCDLPTEMNSLYPAIIDIIEVGYANSLTGLQLAFDRYDRLDYLVNLMTSTQIHAFTNAIANTSEQNAIAYILDIFSNDFEVSEFQRLSKMAMSLFIGEMSPAKTEKWLDLHRSGLGEELYYALKSIGQESSFGLKQRIVALDALALRDQTAKALSAKLRLYLGQMDFPESPSYKVLPIVSKLVKPGSVTRLRLKRMAKNMIRLWENEAPALGDFFSSIASVMHISVDRPIQEFLKDLLSDKSFVSSVNPVLSRIFVQESFLQSIELTAQLGKTGELSRLVNFFYEIAKELPLESLNPKQRNSVYNAFSGDPQDYYKSYAFTPIPLRKDYSSCKRILDHQGNWNSDYLRNLAICFGAEEDGRVYEIMELLESIQLAGGESVLDLLAGFVSSNVLEASYFYPLLDEIEEAYKDGSLNQSIEFLLSLKNDSPQLVAYLESLVQKSCENQNELQTPSGLIAWLSEAQSTNLFSQIFDLAFLINDPLIEPFHFQPIAYSDADRQKNLSIWNDSKYDLADLSWQEDEEAYLYQMEMGHRTRDENYLYQQGIFEYPGISSEEKKSFYLDFVRGLVEMASRGNSLVALWQAIRELEDENFDWNGFFEYTTSSIKMIPIYIGKDSEPMMRLANPLERAEILVQNSRLSIASAVPVVGVEDVGTYFQMELARSSNFKATLKTLKKLTNLGVGYAKFMRRKEKLVKMRNISRNFEVLEELNDRGYLKFFAKVYKSLYDATPKRDRVQKRSRIYTSLVHEPMKIGIFTHLSNWYLQLKRVGKQQELIEAGLSWFTSLEQNQIENMQAFIKSINSSNQREEILSRLYDLLKIEGQGFENWEVVNVIFALSKFKNLDFILPSLVHTLSVDANKSLSLLEFFFNHPFLGKKEILLLVNNLNQMGDIERVQMDHLFFLLGTNPDWLASLILELGELLQENPEVLYDAITELQTWRNAKKDDLDSLSAVRRLLTRLESQAKPLFLALLNDPDLRAAQSQAICKIAQESRLEDLLSLMDDFRSSEGFDNVFKMLRRHFKSEN